MNIFYIDIKDIEKAQVLVISNRDHRARTTTNKESERLVEYNFEPGLCVGGTVFIED